MESRLIEISKILTEYQALFSSWDMDAIKGSRSEHPWIKQINRLTNEELLDFDANRNYKLLKDPDWIDFCQNLKRLTAFESVSMQKHNLETLGNIKKKHEFNQLYTLLKPSAHKTAFDFGGGVGNLANFLESKLSIQVNVLERDDKLIEAGKLKMSKQTPPSRVKFFKTDINSNSDIPYLHNSEFAIGLHTCGSFATDMFKVCIKNKVQSIINFGCCYSKIENEDYNLSSIANKNLTLNSRALSCATLGFSKVDPQIYQYRIRIMDYKYSLYNWVYQKSGDFEFKSMSNSRRSLYKLSFPEFATASLKKYFCDLNLPTDEQLDTFYHSKENQALLKYFKSYYAISRYFGELIETYLLLDRALYLQESGYKTKIVEVFDSSISPRNKAIIAYLQED